MELEWKVPEKSNAIERDRARTYHQAYSALVGALQPRGRLGEIRAGRTKSWKDFKVPAGRRQRRLPRGGPRRALATTWSSRAARSPTTSRTRRRRGTPACATSSARPAPTRTRCRTRRSSRRTGPEKFKGVDIMRAVRSFDPCLPCGVHMYTGKGKVREGACTRRRRCPECRCPSASPSGPDGGRRAESTPPSAAERIEPPPAAREERPRRARRAAHGRARGAARPARPRAGRGADQSAVLELHGEGSSGSSSWWPSDDAAQRLLADDRRWSAACC